MRKLRAIVVEDELNIREGIGAFIEMESQDYEVAALFFDGDEAIEYLKTNDVDLVITDVKMNRISGIELVKYIHENKPGTLAVILSGYREFEYVKSAMTYRVHDYLLKPTNHEELKNMLTETAELIRKRESETNTSSSFDTLLPELRREFFVSLLAGVFKTQETIESKALLLGLKKTFVTSECAVVKAVISDEESFFENVWKYGRDSFNIAIENLIFTTKKDLNCEFYFVGDYRKSHCLFAGMKVEIGDFKSELENDMKILTEAAQQIMLCNLSFVAEETYKNPLELAFKVQLAEDENFSERCTLLKTYISVGNEEDALYLANRLFDELKNAPLPYIKGKLMEIFYSIYIPEGAKIISEENISKLASAQSVEEIGRLYAEQISFMIDCGHRLMGTSQNLIIKRAKQYIEKNFSRDISLQDVADYVHLNPVYFSKYFKEHTHKNFVDYLADIRVDFAKKELIKGKKIDEVSRLSGYNNSSYFAKIFKNSTGMTPREYQRTKIGCE